jgi:hypothetical protein
VLDFIITLNVSDLCLYHYWAYIISKNEQFEVTAMLPISVDINYKIVQLLNVGLNVNAQTKSYHNTSTNPGTENTYVVRQTNELFAYLRFNFGKSIVLQTKVGQSFGRKFRVYDDKDKLNFALPLIFIGDQRTQLNSNFSDGLIFQINLACRLALWQSSLF